MADRYREHLWRPGGYRSYSDYRQHDYGKVPAREPALGGEEGRQLAGHRGQADLERALRSGKVDSAAWTWQGTGKAQIIVVYKDGSSKAYAVPHGTKANTRRIVQAAKAGGVPIDYTYPKKRRVTNARKPRGRPRRGRARRP